MLKSNAFQLLNVCRKDRNSSSGEKASKLEEMNHLTEEIFEDTNLLL